MPDKRFKGYERRIAKWFGTYRTPLSGSHSRHTSSDTLHAKIFIDCKLRREFRSVWRYFKALDSLAKREGKLPALIVKIPGAGNIDSESIVACRLGDLCAISEEVVHVCASAISV